MYNLKKEVFEQLSATDKLPKGLTTSSQIRAAQYLFNEIVKEGSGTTVISEVKNYYENLGADCKEQGVGWNISFQTAEKKQQYFNLLEQVYKDGDVEPFEREQLKQLQAQLGLTDEQVEKIEKNFVEKNKELEHKVEQKKEDPSKKRSRPYSQMYERGR